MVRTSSEPGNPGNLTLADWHRIPRNGSGVSLREDGSVNVAWLIIPSAVIGLVLWSPSEYALHRLAMHSNGDRGPIAGEHRSHHRNPEATALPMRMLLHLGVYALAALAGLALAQLSPPVVAAGLAGGYAVGFASYEILHWRSHHRQPRWAYTRWLRDHHFEHHRHARRAFGVTSGIWDRVFGTA
jgi:sterol desaturase/sphingolipid hydroxylase (fatty acid hydroxylase superfamily)